MITIGTAGHIDHGKSAIVKRLTGTDPDRLPEEKNRGMTIDLGFAFYKTEQNEEIAFVDVPGHERFVKNMISGVGGIDLVMMVIAADDGWMPQSEEHFQIVRLLNIKQGIVIINKIDLVEKDWLDLLENDIKEKVKGTFLEGSPIYKLSAQTGDGFDELKSYLKELPDRLKHGKDIGKPRLYIDRSFIRTGIGGVVTGTLRDGCFKVGQTVGVWPSRQTGKIRTLHSNKISVEKAVPGQRTAVSVTGVAKEHLKRGGVLVEQKAMMEMAENDILVLQAELIKDARITLEDRRRLLFIVGTTEVEGEIRLYDKKKVNPDEKAVLFFKPDEPVFTFIGDRFILRLPTPMKTVGGGVLIDRLSNWPSRKEIGKFAYLEKRIPVNPENLIISELIKNGMVDLNDLLNNSIYSQKTIEDKLKQMWQNKKIGMFEGCFYHLEYFRETVNKYIEKISKYLEQNPHLKGLSSEQIQKINGWDENKNLMMIRYLLDHGQMVKLNDKYSLSGRKTELTGAVKKAYEEIMRQLTENYFTPPAMAKISSGGKQYKDAVRFIIESNQGYKCGSDFLYLNEAWLKIVEFIRERINENNQVAVAELKDKFNLSRKYVIPIFEETDRRKITRRDGDVRVKGAEFEK